MKLSKAKLFISAIFALLALGAPSLALAQSTLPDLLPACAATGACRVCDIVNIFITLGRWLIAGAAGLALLVIVFAGSNIVTSAGNAEKVGAAKKQIVGAVLGLGLVLVAFQLVSFIIFALTTPAADQNFTTSQVPASGAASKQNLGSFLLGVPWWKICDIKELAVSGSQSNGKGLAFPSTASCAYWGDGTACSKSGASKCCQGLCTAAECKIDKIVEPVAQLGATPTVPVQNFLACDLSTETGARKCLLDLGGVTIQASKPPCGAGSDGKGCINVLGLPEPTISRLIEANLQCGKRCIIVTGGTEPGHVSHFPGLNVVDIDYSATAARALESVGVSNSGNFTTGYTCENCRGRKLNSRGESVPDCKAVSCNVADWIHVEI